MKKSLFSVVLVAVSIILMCSCSPSPVSGFTIVEPKRGNIYHPGDRVTLKAMTGPNEQPITVFLYATQMQYSELYSVAPYELSFTIPVDFTGKDTLVASAKFSDGTIVEKEVEINVVLQSNIILTGISVDPTFILLWKLPPDSNPNEVMAYETEDISVGGTYSDGVKRGITFSSSGTTYASSDEKIVTVDKDGNVTAHGVGEATITIRNGKYGATVKISVKPYQQ
jgi:hypothetical protein